MLTCSRALNYCHGTRLVFSLLTAGLTTLSVQLMTMGYIFSSIPDRDRDIFSTNISVPALWSNQFRIQCVPRALYREIMRPKLGAASSHPICLHGLVLEY